MGTLLFNVFALLTVVAAAGVLLNRDSVNAALCLLLSLVGVAGLFIALDAYLLAFLLLLVYAGAIAALFLFIVMLLDPKGDARPLPRLGLVARILAVALVGLGLASFSLPGSTGLAAGPAPGATLKPYAYQLFTTYLLPVQILGFLLLIAMLGVIVLSKKVERAEESK